MADSLITVRMIRDPLDGPAPGPRPEPIEETPPPPGYHLRPYGPGDEATWVAIHREAEQHHDEVSAALFRREFGADEALLAARQLYLCDARGEALGTATAWVNDCADYAGSGAGPGSGDDGWGRIHWVAVVPRAQGRGLGRALVAALCRRFRALGHRRVYLTTETVRLPAIAMYRAFGFRPDARDESERRIWREVEARLAVGRQEGA